MKKQMKVTYFEDYRIHSDSPPEDFIETVAEVMGHRAALIVAYKWGYITKDEFEEAMEKEKKC